MFSNQAQYKKKTGNLLPFRILVLYSSEWKLFLDYNSDKKQSYRGKKRRLLLTVPLLKKNSRSS